MRLRNKKTGEIKECAVIPIDSNGYPNEYQVFEKGNSLAELNEEWEDYKQPDKFYYIDADGYIKSHSVDDRDFNNVKDGVENLIAIGNHFETGEGAAKAREKIEALTRLKDKKFKFDGYDVADRAGDNVICGQVYFKAGNYDREEIEDDLFLLFGGEE